MKSFELLKLFYLGIEGTKRTRFFSEFSKENLRYVKYLISNGLIEPIKIKRKRAYNPIFSLKEIEGYNFIPIRELSTISMVAKNEKKFGAVIHEGKIKEWVGIGWIDKKVALLEDFKEYPIVMI